MTVFITFILSVAAIVLHREYEDWAPRFSAALVRAAARCHPDRQRMKEEWAAEVAAIGENGTDAKGLSFALSVLFSYGLLAPIRILEPGHIFLYVSLLLYWRSPWLLIPLPLIVGSDFYFDRKALLGAEPGAVRIEAFYLSAKTRKGRLAYWLLLVGSMGGWVVLAARRGDPLSGAAAAVMLAYLGAFQFSPRFQRWLTSWRMQRLALIDPR